MRLAGEAPLSIDAHLRGGQLSPPVQIPSQLKYTRYDLNTFKIKGQQVGSATTTA